MEEKPKALIREEYGARTQPSTTARLAASIQSTSTPEQTEGGEKRKALMLEEYGSKASRSSSFSNRSLIVAPEEGRNKPSRDDSPYLETVASQTEISNPWTQCYLTQLPWNQHSLMEIFTLTQSHSATRYCYMLSDSER